MKRLALDTSVATYAIAQTARPDQEQRWYEVRELMTKSGEYEFALPTPALAEVLCAIPDEKQHEAALRMKEVFKVLPLDFDAAEMAARSLHREVRRRPAGQDRERVKFDVLIVACAVRWRCDGLCVYDLDHAGIARRLGGAIQVGSPVSFVGSQVPLPFSPGTRE